MSSSAERCADIVRQFDSQGWHRTATAVDELCGEWLAGRFSQLGLQSHIDRFQFSRVDPDPTFVSTGPTTVHGYPLIDSTLLPRGSCIEGVFGGASRPDGDIALLRFDQHDGDGSLAELRKGEYRAIVVAVDGYPGAFTLLNAWNYEQPHGPPLIQVPGDAFAAFDAARTDGARVTIRGGALRCETTASNIVAVAPGQKRGLQPLVVLTPRSGWWYCAGERGGGIAALLEVARSVQAQPMDRDVVFLATTGHELGFLGVQRYLERHPGFATEAAFWVHLGANIGASGANPIVRSASGDLLSQAESVGFPGARYQRTDAPAGEASIVHAFGGRFVSLIGADFDRFHSTADRWPDAIDPSAIAAHADAVHALLLDADASFGSES
jgi:hypothetical protein